MPPWPRGALLGRAFPRMEALSLPSHHETFYLGVWSPSPPPSISYSPWDAQRGGQLAQPSPKGKFQILPNSKFQGLIWHHPVWPLMGFLGWQEGPPTSENIVGGGDSRGSSTFPQPGCAVGWSPLAAFRESQRLWGWGWGEESQKLSATVPGWSQCVL